MDDRPNARRLRRQARPERGTGPFAGLFFALLSGTVAAPAGAADYDVSRMLLLPMPSAEAWHLVGDFCDIDDWHPGITACALRVIDGQLHRVLTGSDGAETVEQRIAEEPGLSYTYRVVSSPLPIVGLVATFSVAAGEETSLAWSARFSSDDPGMEAAVAGMIETGLTAIEDMHGSQ